MARFIIRYNAGYGDDYEVIDADNMEDAEKYAYEQWRQIAEDSADYEAMEYSEKLAKEFGI